MPFKLSGATSRLHATAEHKSLSNIISVSELWRNITVSLRLRVQNQRTKWNFPPNFQTMRKLSDIYSGIFQTQSSGCASGVNYFRNFTKLKNLNF